MAVSIAGTGDEDNFTINCRYSWRFNTDVDNTYELGTTAKRMSHMQKKLQQIMFLQTI